MHQLWRHPNRVYYVLYGARLRRRVSTGAKDRRKAEAFLAQFIAGADAPVIEKPTVGEILTGYERDRRGHIRSTETLKFNIKALTPDFGQLLPSQLLPSVVRQYAASRRVKPGAILREIGVLRAALAWAVEHQWIAAKPIISNPVKTPRPRDRWLTREEARRLIDACHEPHIKAFVVLGLMTAARTGAILEAQWRQVDFERGVIDYGEGQGTKRRSVVPLNDEVRNVLVALRELACTDFLIECHGRRIASVKKGFRAACVRAGITGVTPHVLRHSAATWMAMDDVPLREIARLLGDREETVERVYAKHSPSYLQRAASALQLQRKGNESALQL